MSKKDGALRAWTGAVPEELLVLIEEAHGDILSHWTLDTGYWSGCGCINRSSAQSRCRDSIASEIMCGSILGAAFTR